MGGPERQPRGVHRSTPLQNEPSLQALSSGTLRHPIRGSHLSCVQSTPSLHSSAMPGAQAPLRHRSTPSHTSLLSHSRFSVQRMRTHPRLRSQVAGATQRELSTVASQTRVTSLQLSRVQSTPSSQRTGMPGRQAPAMQSSVPLQKMLSSQSELRTQRPVSGRSVTTSLASPVGLSIGTSRSVRPHATSPLINTAVNATSAKGRKFQNRRIAKRIENSIQLNANHHALSMPSASTLRA